MKKYNYEGKNVYIGLDVHKKTYAITARSEGLVVKKDIIAASKEGLLNYIEKRFHGGNIYSAYEAGFCGFYLNRFLCKKGIKNIVVHPSSIETAARERVKNDKRDSMKIATQLEAGRLKGIHVPSVKREQYREITRLREDLLKQRKRVSCQIKSLFARYGFFTEEHKKISKKWLKSLENMNFPAGIDFVLKDYTSSWLNLTERIRKVEAELKVQGKEDGDIQKIVESVPGIGPVISRVIINELGDMSQFSNIRNLYSFTGLTPQEYSSGEHTRLGHISRQGRSLLRKTLVQAAWIAIRYDEELCYQFCQLSEKTGKKKAIVMVARKLIGRIRACLKRGEKYVKYKLTDQVEIIKSKQ